LTTAAENASLDEVIRPLILIDLDFSSGHVRLNSTPYSITYSSNVYQGAAKGHIWKSRAQDRYSNICRQ
jgi:hypothetical protein